MKHVITMPMPSEPMATRAASRVDPEDDEDTAPPYDPNDEVGVAVFWKDAIVSHDYDDLRQKLAARRGRGPGKAPRKIPTSLRLDPDVLTGLRALGKGWQTRVNAVLREWLGSQAPGVRNQESEKVTAP